MTALSSRLPALLSDKTGPLAYLGKSLDSNKSSNHWLLLSSLLVPIVFPIYKFVLHDYHDYLSLGPGGTPSTFSGYLRVTFLRVFFARANTYVPPTSGPYECPKKGYLHELPRRHGARPKVAGIAPHRQITQKASSEVHEALAAALKNLETSNSNTVSTGISCFEHHNLALFFSPGSTFKRNPEALSGSALSPPQSTMLKPLNPTCGKPAEISHMHTIDSSMHLTLHPSDAALVLANGWGEMHPLAGRGPWVPRGFVMVYAPRTNDEIKPIMNIVRAGAWWVGGCYLEQQKDID
ncbi:hypothetical protein MMC14_001501 [Varicellaria rhodocarpa]|nr:hypothetical protein [Varicellaria rhodocarpa]